MKWVTIAVLGLALATTALAGDNTNKIIKTKISGPGDGQPFEGIVNDDAGDPLLVLKCSELEMGKKNVEIRWLDPEHMPKAEDKLYFTWGETVKECAVEANCVGLAQLRNFYPEGKSTITVRVVFVGHVANRVKLGTIKPDYFIPVANSPGFWGSVIDDSGLKGKVEEGIQTPKYLDLSEYGAKVTVDTKNYEATFTWTYDPADGFIIEDGQLEIGLIQYQKPE
ncbi:MAG: hypothetical protein PVH29_13960 [Candidatus Zixiibacteriota bacterium]|jgi:hypothetical protein